MNLCKLRAKAATASSALRSVSFRGAQGQLSRKSEESACLLIEACTCAQYLCSFPCHAPEWGGKSAQMACLGLDELALLRQCQPMTRLQTAPPILIAGQGNGAKVAALALVAAGFHVHIEPPRPLADMPDWQNVLALSPAARLMLETLGVWSQLDLPSTAVTNLIVHGQKPQRQSALLPHSLRFATNQTDEATAEAVDVMAHIVSLASLSRAIDRCFAACKNITRLPAMIADHDPRSKTVELENGDQQPCGLLVDATRAARPWRDTAAHQADYKTVALTAEIASQRPHGHMAQQIFTASGPLALLPLADAHRLALIWSLPERRGHALAAADAAIFNHELSRATEGFFGPLEVIEKPAKQPLLLHLAHDFVAPGRVLIGDAAHIIHPLAGQGFNLTLRDIAELADCLHHGRHLGLASDDFSMLEAYQTHRRSDAGLTVAATDGLNRIFSTRHSLLTGLASLGLGVSDGLARRFPEMRRAFAAQADYGTSPPARLMRGENFTD